MSLAAACRCGAETEPWDEAGETAAMREKGANPAYVQKVASGAFRRARVSWWGFDAADSTRFVQAAIDSGVPVLTLDRMDSAWQVTPVVIRRQDFTLTFEDGATLLAKEGAFLPIDDKLLTVTASTNVTLNGRGVLRMRRDDYKKAPYVKAEWRHCLIIGASRRVTVDGLRMEESGGDGITLGTGAEGVTIRNCVCDRNFRQGISVCSARDLLIENCALVNTGGTAPAAGIDFEPDYDGLDEVANCVMRNCVITNNQGSGIDVCLNNLTSAGAPVSLLIEGCLCDRNSSGTTVRYSRTDQCLPGEVVYRDCTFSRSWSCGIGFERKSADAFDVRFERCRIEDCGSGASGYEIDFFPPNWAARIADGIVFDDVSIRQKWRRPWLGVENANFADRPKAISGRVFVTDPGGAVTTNVITSALLAAAFPPDGEPPLPRYELDYREVTLVDDSEGILTSLTPVAFQSRVCIDFYLAKAGRVRFVMKQNASRPEDVAQTLAGHVHARFDPTFYHRIDIPGMEAEEIAFDVPNGGWYLLWVSPGYRGPLQIVSANCPVAVNLCEGPVSLRAAAETADVWREANMPTHSEPVFLNLRPKVSSFWHTAPGESFDVPVSFPEGARSATLRVTGSAGTRTYANIVDTSCTVQLPTVSELHDEDVYTLTLTFDNGVERTAVLGQVTGWSRGDAGVTRCLSPEDEAWHRTTPRSVLPIPYGTRSLTVDGKTVDPGLDGAQGWYALRRRAGSQVLLELETDKGSCSSDLKTEGPAGLFMMLR